MGGLHNNHFAKDNPTKTVYQLHAAIPYELAEGIQISRQPTQAIFILIFSTTYAGNCTLLCFSVMQTSKQNEREKSSFHHSTVPLFHYSHSTESRHPIKQPRSRCQRSETPVGAHIQIVVQQIQDYQATFRQSVSSRELAATSYS